MFKKHGDENIRNEYSSINVLLKIPPEAFHAACVWTKLEKPNERNTEKT